MFTFGVYALKSLGRDCNQQPQLSLPAPFVLYMIFCFFFAFFDVFVCFISLNWRFARTY